MKVLKPSEKLAALEKEELELLAKIGDRKQLPEERKQLDQLDDLIRAANGEVAREWAANRVKENRIKKAA